MFKAKLRFYWRLVQTFLSRHFKAIVGGLILAALLVFSFLRLSSRPPVWRFAVVGQYQPQNLPSFVSGLISYGLVKVDGQGNFSPGIASSWETVEEGKNYRFHLVENLFWHDGQKVKAQDINYRFQDLKLTPLDNETLEISLEEKYASLLDLLSQPVFKANLIGVGEYRLKKWQRQGETIKQLSLENKDKNKPQIIFKFYPNEESARHAFKMGEVDIIWGLQNPDNLVYFPNVTIEAEINNEQYTAVFFNLQKETLAEKSVRQALAYATPKPQGKNRAKGPYSPASWVYNDFVKTYDFDFGHAKELLGDQKISLQLATFPNYLTLAEKIKESWEKIGVSTEIRVVNFIPDDYDALLLTQAIPQNPDQYWFWHSSQTQTNITHLNNPRLDQLLEEGRITTDKEKRREIYADFQRFLLEESPAIFIEYPTYHYVFRHGFENAKLSGYN
ncbi:hypothetical protein KBI33_02745 [Candidatus Shapirobacteria bacterium]|nr:hypothetical protein [Candidatus Shapirobacteria bacterium]